MLAFLKTSPRILAAVLAAASLFLPVASPAQELPPYATAPAQDQQIHGRIESIDGTFNLTVRDDNGYLDAIQLRQGTIINPTGLTLAPGMVVTILGYASGSVFNANQIDTPYNYSGPAPTPVYYGAGWWYPGFAYGYGPSFSLGIVVGFGGGYNCYQTPWAGHWWGGSPSWYHGGTYAYGGSSHGGYGNGAPPSNGNAPHGGYGGQGSGFTGQPNHPGEPGYPHQTPTEPHNFQPQPPYHPVPVTGQNTVYHAPSSGVTYHAPSNPGTYRAPTGGGSRAPASGGGGGYHASGGGGGSHGGGGGGARR